MDAKDFIFPGVILALVIIIGLGLLFTHSDNSTLLPSITAVSTATSTVATTTLPAITTNPSTSAASSSDSSAASYGSVTLALGQAAAFADGTSIRPMHVLEDSRCPADVECIQAGTVKLSLTVVSSGKTVTETLSIGQSVRVGSDTITFDSAAPQKAKAGYPASGSYRFTFTVTHG